jgi:hypothetical protein
MYTPIYDCLWIEYDWVGWTLPVALLPESRVIEIPQWGGLVIRHLGGLIHACI